MVVETSSSKDHWDDNPMDIPATWKSLKEDSRPVELWTARGEILSESPRVQGWHHYDLVSLPVSYIVMLEDKINPGTENDTDLTLDELLLANDLECASNRMEVGVKLHTTVVQ